jgi:hypothetical protein
MFLSTVHNLCGRVIYALPPCDAAKFLTQPVRARTTAGVPRLADAIRAQR